MFLDLTLLNMLSALTLCHELSTVLNHVAHIVLIPDLGLASRAILSGHRACQESLVEYSSSKAVQALHLQVLTTLRTDHDRVSYVLLSRGSRQLHPFGALHYSVSDEFVDARLTKHDVTLAAF